MKNGLFPSLTNKKEDKHETDITTTLRNNTCSYSCLFPAFGGSRKGIELYFGQYDGLSE